MPDKETETGTPEETQTQQSPVDVEALQAELANLKAQYEEKDKGFKTLQTELNKKGAVSEEIQSLKDMIAAMAATRNEDYAPDGSKDFMKTYEQINQKSAEAKKVEELKRIGNEYKTKVEALGLTEDDAEYWDIHRDVVSMNYKAADARLKRLEKQKSTPTEEKPTEKAEAKNFHELSDEEKDEAARKYLEEKGLLKTDTAGPSAGTKNFKDIEKGYSEGTVSLEEYMAARRQQGL